MGYNRIEYNFILYIFPEVLNGLGLDGVGGELGSVLDGLGLGYALGLDRKSTRLNSSH